MSLGLEIYNTTMQAVREEEPEDTFSLLDSLPFTLRKFQYSMLATAIKELEAAPENYLVRMYNYGANSVGKTTLLAIISMFHLMRYGFERPHETYTGTIVSGSHTQLYTTLVKELHYLLNNSAFGNYLGIDNQKLYIKNLEREKYIRFCICNAANVDSFAGVHAQNILTIFDEASAIHDKAFEIAESFHASGRGLFYIAGNTTNPVGLFAKNYLKKDEIAPSTANESTYHYHITRFDVGGPDDPYAQRLAYKEGVDSRVYRERVLAQFCFDHSLRFFSQYDVDEALDRGRKLALYPYTPKSEVFVGLDVATGAADCETVAVVRDASAIIEIVVCKRTRNEIAEWLAKEVLIKYPNLVAVGIDAIGVGNGIDAQVRSLLAPLKKRFKNTPKIIGIISSHKAIVLKGCRNLRAELFVEFRGWLDRQGAILPGQYVQELVDNMGTVEQVDDEEYLRIAPKKGATDYVDAAAYSFVNIHDVYRSYDNFL
jgi:hypothetical protein